MFLETGWFNLKWAGHFCYFSWALMCICQSTEALYSPWGFAGAIGISSSVPHVFVPSSWDQWLAHTWSSHGDDGPQAEICTASWELDLEQVQCHLCLTLLDVAGPCEPRFRKYMPSLDRWRWGQHGVVETLSWVGREVKLSSVILGKTPVSSGLSISAHYIGLYHFKSSFKGCPWWSSG